MHIAIRRYKIDPASVRDLMTKVERGFVPMISKAPGFIGYYAIDAGEGIIASISIFKDKAGADESSRMAASWVKENLAGTNPPEITAGTVTTHKIG